jgi:hypothetical protein
MFARQPGAVGTHQGGIIKLNPDYPFAADAPGCVNGYLIEEVVTHELGHAAGIGHAADKDDVMYEHVYPCRIRKARCP